MKSFTSLAISILLLFSSHTYGSSSSYKPEEKLATWLQFFLLQEEDIALEYRSLSIRNGTLEISDLSITDFIYPSDFAATRINSLDQLLAANQNTAPETIFSAKKIKINLGYLDKFLTFVMTRDKDMIKEFYKSETYLLFDEIKVSSDLSSASSELFSGNDYVSNRITSYLDTFSLNIASKAKGRLRSNMEVDFAFGNDLSFNFSIDTAVDEELISAALTPGYFNMLLAASQPFMYIANQIENFVLLTSDSCADLYSKNNLEAWISVANGEYCRSGLEFLESAFDDIEGVDNYEDLIDSFDEDLLYLNQPNTKIFESNVNVAWSERLFNDISLLSGGTVDAGLFTMKSLLAEKLTKSEFEQTLGFFLMDPEVSSIASGFSFDELYRVYSDYYFKLKSFANNPKGIGVSVKSKDGLDTEYLLYLAENPLLVMGLLNSIELELLLNKRN